MASAEEKDTLKLKTDFPFFDAIHEVLGVRDVANSEFRIHVESTSVTPPESRATSSAQEDLKVGVVAELSVSGSSNGETDKSTVSGHVNDQETNQASAKHLQAALISRVKDEIVSEMSNPAAKKFGPQTMELKKENPENTYQIKAEVARGKYAVIKRCMEKKTKKNMMAKLIKYDSDTVKLAIQEFEIMKDFKCDKLLTARDGFQVRKYIVIMIDGVEAKNMLEFIGEKPRANEEDAAFVMRQTLDALKYLHGMKVVHLDVRPANILVKKDYTLKLIDYGCARKIKTDAGELVDAIGVTEFSAPELLNMDPVCWAADMWSIGVLMYILLSATLPFTSDDEDEVSQAVTAVDYDMPPEKFSKATDEAKALIKSLLVRVPEKRPNATQVLAGDWLGNNNAQKRKTSDIPSSKFKDLNQKLVEEDKEEAVVASCVLRSFDEDEYESPEEDEED
ncbi:hypothetical protein QZH41_002071 [Actinostola sp. cb2023]|nr:hypothetical protein QZH41_002071 [Actinostola sp. cb2023]